MKLLHEKGMKGVCCALQLKFCISFPVALDLGNEMGLSSMRSSCEIKYLLL